MQSHIISQQFNRIFCVLCVPWQLTRRILELSQLYAQPNVSAQYNAINNMFFFLRTATLCRRRLKTLQDIYSHKKLHFHNYSIFPPPSPQLPLLETESQRLFVCIIYSNGMSLSPFFIHSLIITARIISRVCFALLCVG
jgi:hypothetical protein